MFLHADLLHFSMNLFINDIPIRIIKRKVKPDIAHFNHVLDARNEPITKTLLRQHLLMTHASADHVKAMLAAIHTKAAADLVSLTISVEDYTSVKLLLKNKFRIIKAAGGVVKKKGRLLMIYRMKKWDLPKGKREIGETSRETAVREVNEECNVEVKLGNKICTTWHTYTMNKKNMLKKTTWYAMELVDDSNMKPSLEEDIEELRWMSKKEISKALENSYNSIRFVFEELYKTGKKKK